MAGQERKSRRGEILQRFTEMVAERGYDEVSLRDVADDLGMSKGTILHHFGTKDRLLEELHADYMRRRLGELHVLLARFDDPVDQLRAIVYQLLVCEQDDRAATVAFAREIVRFSNDDVMSDVREMRREYSGLVRDVIRAGIDRGAFVDVDPTLASLQIFGMCNWSWTWFEPEGAWSAADIADAFCRTLLDGLMRDGAAHAAGADVLAAVVETMATAPPAAASASSGRP